MTSQLNVDTIVDKAGSGGTNVKVANTSTFVSDGGAVTQNTVQGLAKAWAAFDGSGTVEIDDSNNIASMTDNGTGDYTLTITNDMANANYAPVSSCNFNGTSPDFVGAVSKAVGSTEFHAAHDNGTLTDMNDLYASWHGDLA
jgi:hypothetical protein